MDQYQRDNATVLVRVGRGLGAPTLALIAMLELGWGENDMRASGCNSSDHCGLFQLSAALQAEHDYHDVAYWARRAYLDGFWSHGGIIPNARAHPDWGPGYIVNLCQGAYSDLAAGGAYYDRYRGLAETTLRELAGVAPGAPGGGGGWGGQIPKLIPNPEHDYDPWLTIRHDFYQLGQHGRRAYGNAAATRAMMSRTTHCTRRGPSSR